MKRFKCKLNPKYAELIDPLGELPGVFEVSEKIDSEGIVRAYSAKRGSWSFWFSPWELELLEEINAEENTAV